MKKTNSQRNPSPPITIPKTHPEDDDSEPRLGNDEAEEEDDDDHHLLGFAREDDDDGVTNGNEEKDDSVGKGEGEGEGGGEGEDSQGLWNLDEAGFIAHFGRDQFLRLIFRPKPYLSAKSRYVKEIN